MLYCIKISKKLFGLKFTLSSFAHKRNHPVYIINLLKVCKIIAISIVILLLGTQLCSAESMHEKRYRSLHKTFFQGTAGEQVLSEYNRLRKGPPKRFFEIGALPETSHFRQMGRP